MMNLKSRKLIAATVLFTTSVVFVGLGKADFVSWAEFIKWVMMIYVGGNVGEHYTNKMNKK